MAHREQASPMLFARGTENYSYNIPEPPRILVPPPVTNNHARPVFHLVPRNLPENPFLRDVKYDKVGENPPDASWKYHFRHQAQMVLPFLHLGAMNAAKDPEYLKQNNITMMIGVRPGDIPTTSTDNDRIQSIGERLMTSIRNRASALGIIYHEVSLYNTHQLVHLFPDIITRINTHISEQYHNLAPQTHFEDPPPGVLIFCETGNERSAIIAAAYVMTVMEDVDYITAMQVCQAQRFCVNFHEELKGVLQTYWDILRAERAVERQLEQQRLQQQRWSQPRLVREYGATDSGGKKRKMEKSEDEMPDGDEMECDSGWQNDDVERFEGRSVTPFVDGSL